MLSSMQIFINIFLSTTDFDVQEPGQGLCLGTQGYDKLGMWVAWYTVPVWFNSDLFIDSQMSDVS